MSTDTAELVLYDAPGRKTVARHRLYSIGFLLAVAAVVAWVLHGLAAKGQFEAAKWTPFLQADVWTTFLLPGIKGTLTAAAIAIVLALLLGITLAVGRMSSNRWLSLVSAGVVEFFRAMPLLVLMIFCFALYAGLNLFPAEQLALAAVVTGLTLCNAAVIAELVRAGVRALPKGQTEAANALGMSTGQRMRMILLPQAITAMLPAMVAQMVVALKDTALGYQITYVEMVRQGIQTGNAFSNYIPSLIVVATMMVAINVALGRLAVRLERRLRTRGRSVKSRKPVSAIEPVPAVPSL